MHSAIKETNIDGTIINKSKQLLAYADDIVLIARNREALVESFLELENHAKKMDLRINEKKTKYIKVFPSAKRHPEQALIINQHNFKAVTDFTWE